MNRFLLALLAVVVLTCSAGVITTRSQGLNVLQSAASNASQTASKVEADLGPNFRVEKVPVPGGAEIVTIFAKRSAFGSGETKGTEVPLISILRDTLGDPAAENDRLRYVWMLTMTNPTAAQRVASFVPFLYTRIGNKKNAGNSLPKAVIDMHSPEKAGYGKLLWSFFRGPVLGIISRPAKAVLAQNATQTGDYDRSGVAEALLVLSQIEDLSGEKFLTQQELKDIQSRLWLTDKSFGSGLKAENLNREYDRETLTKQANRGQTHELLRRFSESQGLYFDPIELPDGSSRHAIIWVAKEDLDANKNRNWDGRFLNIKNPWRDGSLRKWQGYTERRWYNEESREVPANTPGATVKTLIPLAVYGFDHPKIPAILVDFRNSNNPAFRELTHHLVDDLSSDFLTIRRSQDWPLMFAHKVFSFVTGRRGMDINQPTRVRAYSELKMMLALDQDLAPKLRTEMADRVERVALNPLQNDLDSEINLARAQYKNLMAWAKRPDGLGARLELDRRKEMTRIANGGKSQFGKSFLNLVTFGLYKGKAVKSTPELVAKMDIRRKQQFHERVIRECAYLSSKPEIDFDTVKLLSALQFMSVNGVNAGGKTAVSLATVFSITDDEQMRSLALEGLYRINKPKAKSSLLAIYQDPKLDPRWKDICAKYLKKALAEGQEILPRDAAAITAIGVN
ncbi:MAG: hypothetical protein JO053_09975 [Acidobacteria bacterium]|nr:hypothetical protein [Acidobacteriota bacterium]